MRENSRLRFAVYLDQELIPAWQKRAVELLTSLGNADFVLLIRAAAPRPSPAETGGFAASLPLRLYLSLWADRVSRACRKVGIGALADGVERVVCQGPSGTIETLTEAVETARRHDLDFVLHCGSGDVAGELVGCSRHGVWRFTDARAATGAWPFLAEICNGPAAITFALERIDDRSPRGDLLFLGRLRPIVWSYVATRDRVLNEAARWPALVARDIALNGQPRPVLRPAALTPVRAPSMARLATRLGWNFLRRIWAELFEIENWNVGITRTSIHEILAGRTLDGVEWLPPHRLGRYIADPFIYRTGSRVTCLVENFDHFRRGRISEVVVWPITDRLELETKLEEPHHLSYPCLVKHGGVSYCLPEAGQSSGATLYRCTAGGLVPVMELIKGQQIVDGTMLHHGGYHWLFCGLRDDHDMTNLHLFFAPDLLGPWQAHPLNPVKVDVTSSRPAGHVIAIGTELYRPAQNCAVTYGGGISISRIDALTPTRFSETLVAEIGPVEGSPYRLGVHTLAVGDGFIVIDGKRQVTGAVALLTLPVRLGRRLGRGFARMRDQFAQALGACP
jgi:hypothetical protein